MTYHLPIIIEECEEGGYYGECPALQGCHVEGDTLDETRSELLAAMQGMIEEYKVSGQPLPIGFPMMSVIAVEA